ncbi:MAG TPA: XylR family transcriptional regulator, partial [Lacipirellulaceae bacterium]|nr:XylR family transcriptional regulator [Lacipirellulaceae bacterium]
MPRSISAEPEPPKVALLIETSRGYGRQLLWGIVRYARLHGPWRFYLTPGDFAQALPQMSQWRGSGIIARIETVEMARAILAARVPTIALDASQSLPIQEPRIARFCEVASDSHAAARLAAEHLLERGFRHYAFVGEPDRKWSHNREQGFRQRLRGAGLEPLTYRWPSGVRKRRWEREQPVLGQWLRELPKPVGILACNDDRGRQVLDACRACGVAVPVGAGRGGGGARRGPGEVGRP